VLVWLAGCYHPDLPSGAPCDDDRGCPASQRCIANVCGGPSIGNAIDAGAGGDDDGAPQGTVELRDDFKAGLGAWTTLPDHGTWSADAMGARIASPEDSEDYLLRQLPAAGHFRITLELTVEALTGTMDHLIGFSLVSSVAPYRQGAECSLSQQFTGPRQIFLWDPASGADHIDARDYAWEVGASYQLVGTTAAPDRYDCTVAGDLAARRAAGTATAVDTIPVLTLHATGLTARLTSVVVERL